jgi:hypothetical protein
MIAGTNRYYKYSKTSEAKFRQLLKAFAMDFSASDTARLTGLSRSTNSIFLKIRARIARYCEIHSPGKLKWMNPILAQLELEASGAVVLVAKPLYLA